RVHILPVSAIDLMLKLGRDIDTSTLKASLIEMIRRSPGLIAYSDHPHASVDFNNNPHSVIIDSSQIRSNSESFGNIFLWFDNEWGFANRMLDATLAWAGQFHPQALQTEAGLTDTRSPAVGHRPRIRWKRHDRHD